MTFPSTGAGERPPRLSRKLGTVGRLATNIVCVVGMAAVIVAVDILLFRHHFWERLSVNFGIVLVFVAFYFRFLHR